MDEKTKVKNTGIISVIAVIVIMAFFAYHGGYAIGQAKAHYENSRSK